MRRHGEIADFHFVSFPVVDRIFLLFFAYIRSTAKSMQEPIGTVMQQRGLETVHVLAANADVAAAQMLLS
jgi:hypothetical protein